ncbi:Cys-tRNA(Pro) deacylase [Alteromonas ponticola]|uniref:Cys-tRNA(Pro)/Cys-tRNA(Cys) deacylase n=1 Tax=Alteromonas ponticola TaxID=2720613 RepID=A0ABX1R2B2_9ALTE|nr:Cys-tRNA(Pro) deacylase [Alteromonas ponticola]NMH60056.1 Cys-tRNA(Pro) deacylase [Alteromonas ponticola]
MTPAIKILCQANIAHHIHTYKHAPDRESYGLEAAEKLGVPAVQVFKTLVVSLDTNELVVGLLPVTCKLNMKQIAKAAGAKKASMAAATLVERATGYVLGGVSPLGQKKRLRTFIDTSAHPFKTIYISAGRRGVEIEMNPEALRAQLNARFAELTC